MINIVEKNFGHSFSHNKRLNIEKFDLHLASPD